MSPEEAAMLGIWIVLEAGLAGLLELIVHAA